MEGLNGRVVCSSAQLHGMLPICAGCTVGRFLLPKHAVRRLQPLSMRRSIRLPLVVVGLGFREDSTETLRDELRKRLPDPLHVIHQVQEQQRPEFGTRHKAGEVRKVHWHGDL